LEKQKGTNATLEQEINNVREQGILVKAEIAAKNTEIEILKTEIDGLKKQNQELQRKLSECNLNLEKCRVKAGGDEMTMQENKQLKDAVRRATERTVELNGYLQRLIETQ
jgi:predicted  nucleic acid-binding Zn-ribbon protein